MASQTINTATNTTGLDIGGNIINGNITVGKSTNGRIDIGNPNMNGKVNIETDGDLVLSGKKFEFHTKGIVEQLTSDTSPVTINNPVGTIISYQLSSPNHSSHRFIVYNNVVTPESAILLTINHCGPQGHQIGVCVNAKAMGQFEIVMQNTGGPIVNDPVHIVFLVM